MKETADLAAGKTIPERSSEPLMDRLLSDEDHMRVTTKLSDMLTSVCDYCHERLGTLVSASPNENEKEKSTNDASNKSVDKETNSWNDKSWLSERATTAQVCKLANIVDSFTETCEKLCGKQCIALRSAFKVIYLFSKLSCDFLLEVNGIQTFFRPKQVSLYKDSMEKEKSNWAKY